MAAVTVRTNGQTLLVNASVSHWTSAALAEAASSSNDVESSTTTTITSDYTMHFANTATTARVTVKQHDGTVLTDQTYEVNPGVGPRTLNPIPDLFQLSTDVYRRACLNPSGVLAATFDRASNYTTNQAILTSGTLHLVAIPLTAGQVVTNISFVSRTTAASAPTNQWFALYDSARGLLGQTADATSAAWAAQTVKTLALTAPHTVTYSGLHYLGILVTASTVPSLVGSAQDVTINGIAPIISGNSTTSLTGTAPATAATLTAASVQPYAYVS